MASLVEQRATRLASNETSVDEKQRLVNEFRDNVEELMTGTASHQGAVMRSLMSVLQSMAPQRHPNAEHKLRKSILEVVNRVPHADAMKQHVSLLSRTLLDVATEDNEENAVVALRVMLDLIRAFKPPLEEVASKLLNLFIQLYGGWDEMCRYYFVDLSHYGQLGEEPLNMDMQSSKRSFKVVAECPITVLYLLQLYGNEIKDHVPPLLSLMVKALRMERTSKIGPHVQQAYKDMKFAQVKTVAFLSHYVKQSVHLMQRHEREICDGLMHLLKSCPDVVQWRRELLISTRTLLATDFRRTLEERLNDLKDESAIVGSSRSCYEALRHYGYAVFAELAHQTRQKLKLDQLRWIVHRSCCISADTERPAASHSTAIRLLQHLVEVIHRLRQRPDGTLDEAPRELLQSILLCFVTKLNALRRAKKLNAEVQPLLHNLFAGLRSVLHCLTTYNKMPTPSPQSMHAPSLTEQEIRFSVKIIKSGIEALKMCFRLKMQGSLTELMEIFVDVLCVLDPKDFVEIISSKIGYIYASLSGQSELHPIVWILLDRSKMVLYFLTIMTGYLADHKLEILGDPDQEEHKFLLKLFKVLFHTLLRPEVHTFFVSGDPKSAPLVTTLVKITRISLEKAKTTIQSQGYLQLLWFLFRYLNRSHLQFPEMASLLPSALDLFLSMLDGPEVGISKDLLIELCLLLPLKLEKKYPVLPKLMKPLLMALKGTDDMALLAIQTMEEWIDRLNPDFLEIAMSSLVQEINLALWSHLKPQHGTPLGPKVLQLLGKLGGRNRRFLTDPLNLEWKDNQDQGLRLILTFNPHTTFMLPFDKCIELTYNGLMTKLSSVALRDVENGTYYRLQGLQFIHACLATMMNLKDVANARLQPEQLKTMILSGETLSMSCSMGMGEHPGQIKSQYLAEKQTLKSLIAACIVLCSDVELKDEGRAFARQICHHFALLFHMLPPRGANEQTRSFLHMITEDFHHIPTVKYIEPDVFIEALIQVATDEQGHVAKCGADALRWFLEMLLVANEERSMPIEERRRPDSVLLKSDNRHQKPNFAKACGLPIVVDTLMDQSIDCCFGDTSSIKRGGIYCIEVLIDTLPVRYLSGVFLEVLQSILHLMQTLPSHCISFRSLSRKLLLKLTDKVIEAHARDIANRVPMEKLPELTEPVKKLGDTVFLLNVPESVREDCHACLSLLCRSFRKSMTELLDRLLNQQNKNLRKYLEECVQSSYRFQSHNCSVTAFAPHMEGLSRLLIYCIQQQLPSVPLLLTQILECAEFAMLLCDASEEVMLHLLTSSPRPERLSILTKMRESALKVLVAISSWNVFLSNSGLPEVKKSLEAMTHLFFKTLISRDDKLRQISKTGLTTLLQGHRITQYDCQAPLSPLLARLNRFNTLDLNLLKGGAEALRMISDWFNLILGEKLLDYLKKWLDPESGLSFQRSWPPAQDTEIAAAILEMFHLLPDPASTFLETQKTGTDRIGLVVLSIELEERLGQSSPVGPVPHILWSPYRAPLAKFLVKYRTEAVAYFLAPTRMQNASYVTRFIDIIKSDIGKPLLIEVMNSGNQLISLLNSDASTSEAPSTETPAMASLHALQLIKTIVKLKPDWLPRQPGLFQSLFRIWKELSMTNRSVREASMSPAELFQCKAIAKSMLNYISVQHPAVDALVALLTVFECSSKVDFKFIKTYCMDYVPETYTHQELQQLLIYILHQLNDHMSQGQSIFVMRFLVMPILKSLNKKSETIHVVTAEMMQLYLEKAMTSDERRDVCLEMELLDMGRLLAMGVPHLCGDRTVERKILKYPWSFLKCDNVECKSHAFLMVAHLFRTVRYTDRTILQVFVNLLKSDFSETKRELIQEALDVMVPALVENFEHQTTVGRFPQWIEHAIKHMQGEGHKVNLLMNLWQMVIGHPDLFYAYGSQFLGQMVNTLSRLRRPPANAAPENRQMAIDIERVIVNWEVKRIKESTEGTSTLPPPLTEETFANMKKMVVTLLAKTAFTVPPDHGKDASVKYAYGDILSILNRGLEIWPDVDFRLDFVERLIEGNQMQPQQLSQILTAGLDLVSLALEHQPRRFLEYGWNHIAMLALKVVAQRKEDLLEKLCAALEIVFSIDEPGPFNLHTHLKAQLFTKYLDPANVLNQEGSEYGISACLKILESDKEYQTGMLRHALPWLVLLLERHVREYTVVAQNTAPASLPQVADAQTVPLPTFGQHMYNVCKIIQLCGGRLHDLGHQDRETFVVSMVRFVSCKGGRIPDRAIFYQILVVVSNWLREVIENGESPALTQKLLLWSMQQICQLDANGLVEPYMKVYFDGLFLTAIYNVCTTPVLNAEFRRDVFAHVEQLLLCGVRTTTPDLRKKFFQLYQSSLGGTLFERLRFILQTQDWEHVASRFWLKQALDYLLALLKADVMITFAPGSSHLVPFPTPSTELLHHSVLDLSLESEGMEIDREERTPFEGLLANHLEFIRNKSSFCADDLMSPLREYAHVNNELACHLWIEIFPIVWATLDKNSQMSLAKPPIISILSKQYHSAQAHHRPNVIQGLLKGISLSQPQPRIPPELIKYLGKTYNAWHVAITLLESRMAMFPEEARNFDALAELYRLLSETDIMFGLLKKGFKNPFTQAGVNLMQYGHWEQAQHQFGVAAVQATEGSMRPPPPAREVLLWSEQWCRCAKELNQWDELHCWADESGSTALLADASWRLQNPDWSDLRTLLELSRDQFPDKLQHSILMAYSSQDNGMPLSNSHITHAIEQCLQRWWQLPEIGTLGQVHLLQKFQQVVEVCESSRACMELGPNRNLRHEPTSFTKEILETWRLRSPNMWEPLSVWSEVFIWRHIIYTSIANTIGAGAEPNSPSLHHLCIKDKACSINRLANVARKHGALDVCISIEHNMYNDNYMDIQEAFLKIVQQSKAYLLMDDQKMTGLSMLCSTNLDYFPYQGLQAEIFRLQGEYYRALDDHENATKSYSTSITLNHQLPETWLCWGAFCDDIYEKTKTDSSSVIQLEYAVGCYFQAMQLSSSAARAMIPRCLQLLSFDRTGTVDKVFKEQLHGADTVPSWFWLFYIPQILAVLDRPEGESLKYILPKIIQSHPQALFYFLRVHMLNTREAASAAMDRTRQGRFDGSASASQSESVQHSTGTVRDDTYPMGNRPNARHNFDFAKEWMDRLKLQLGPLHASLETMLREIASNCMAKPEERLMAVVHVLLARCCKAAGIESMEIPQGLIREIDGVCQACFPESHSSTAVHDDFKEAFVQHLSPKADGFPRTLGELTKRLKRWRNFLSQYLDEHMPSTLQLHKESLALQDLNLHGIEMPCQYSKSPDAMVDTPVYLEKMSSEIHVIRRQGTAFRRIAFYDSEGRKTHFILQNGHTYGQPASSEERMLQLMCLINRLLNRHHQCRSRFLKFFAPVIVPVWNKVRLVEEDPCFTTFLEPLDLNCQLRQCETDIHLMLFKQRIYSGEAPVNQLAPAAFKEITEHIADNIFSRYMYTILPSNKHLWVFRKQFCSQMALSSLMSVMLSIGGRVPGKILFSRSTGKVLQVDFYPGVSLGGYVHQNDEAVPFRLTRNLTAFFTPFGVEGVFMTSMVSAAMAMTQRHSNLSSCLSLFFRDELLAWASRRESRAHYTASMAQLQPLVEKNVNGAMSHIQSLCPVVPKSSPDDRDPPGVVNAGVKGLVEKATNPHHLCMMDPTWHPWY